jgi:hypothetical protein
MTTFNWTIATLEYDLQPSDMDGAVIVAHWRVNAEETTGEGDDAVTYTASSYGTCGFSPDPSAEGYVPYADLTDLNSRNCSWVGGENTIKPIDAQ